MSSRPPPRKESPKYGQKFRNVWLQDPMLKDWLRTTTTAVTTGDKEPKVLCKCIYCDKILHPRYCDLLKHYRTTKHTTAAEKLRAVNKVDVDSEYDTNDDTNSQQDIEPQKPDKTTTRVVLGTPRTSNKQESSYTSKRSMLVSESGDISVMEDDTAVNIEAPEIIYMNSTSGQDDEYYIQSSMEKLKLEKLKLEVEKERVSLYKLRLESLKLEKELHLPRSTHTASLKVIEIPH